MEMPYQLEVLWCRTFQSVLKIGNYFMGYRMPKYLEGPGKIKELGAFLKEKGINDVLVVTGTGMVRRGQVQPMLDGFDANGIRYTLQTYSNTDPTSDDVEAGYKTYKENGCKSIVALGGGSRIDCAKGIAAKAVHPKKSVAQLQGLLAGSRLVHAAAADHVNRYGADTAGKCGYTNVGILGAASSAESLKSLRTKYPKLFLLADGYDYPNANAKNCANAFDKFGHGAVVCGGTGITCAWKTAESHGEDYLDHAKAAAERMKKNLTRYVTVL